jgi:hypothetical protein
MAITKQERATFGWLGRIPPEIIDAPGDIVAAYRALSKRAGEVAHLPNGAGKVKKAKEIETEYRNLIYQSKKHAKRQLKFGHYLRGQI